MTCEHVCIESLLNKYSARNVRASFISAFAVAFDGSRAHHVIGAELRLELNQLDRTTQRSLTTENHRRLVLTAPHSRLLHECLSVAHACQTAPDNIRALMPDCFPSATRDACYAMQQFDNYLIHKRIDTLDDMRVCL